MPATPPTPGSSPPSRHPAFRPELAQRAWGLPRSRVLVTGATGFIGGHLTERLLALGAHVRVFARRPERTAGLAAAGAEVLVGDLTEPRSLRGCCTGCEVVFHCGAWLGRPYTRAMAWTTNVEGTDALAGEALAAGVARFVHLSSITVYGPVRAGVVTEASPAWPGVELYGDSKIAAEEVLRRYTARGLPVVITRPGMVYGPRSRGWTIRMVNWIRRGVPAMVAGGHGLARPNYVDNLVDALLLCATRPVAGEMFTLVDEDMPWRQYLSYYAQMVGRAPRSIPYAAAWLLASLDELRSRLTGRPPRVRRTSLGYTVSTARFSTERARGLLGWSPRVSTREAMEITRRWLVENGYLPGAETRPMAASRS